MTILKCDGKYSIILIQNSEKILASPMFGKLYTIERKKKQKQAN